MIKVKTVELRKNLQHYIDLALSGEEVILEYKGGVEIRLQPNIKLQDGLNQGQKILNYFDSPDYIQKLKSFSIDLELIPDNPKDLKKLLIKNRSNDYDKIFKNSQLKEDAVVYNNEVTVGHALLDTSIVLDIICRRGRFDQVKKVLESFDKLSITTFTYFNCFYILQNTKLTVDFIQEALMQYTLVETPARICYMSCKLAKSKDDVEDCGLILIAKENKTVLVTADKDLVKRYGSVNKCILVE